MRLSHEDTSKIDALEKEMLKKNDEGRSMACPFQHLRPNPTGEWDYNWSIENWGTKWEADIIDWERSGDNEITIYCNTAWSPPTALYEYLTDEGWTIYAVYHEPGMAYAGMFTDTDGDDYYEYDITDKESIENLPSDIVDFAGLEDAHEDWLANEEEERLRDLPRTEWYEGTVNPHREGRYEIHTKDYPYDHYASFNGEDWGFNWDGEAIIPTKWRGLVEEYTDTEGN
jgi:hypothetical protein